MLTSMPQQNRENISTLFGLGAVPTGATITTCPAPVGGNCPGGSTTTPAIGNIFTTGVTLQPGPTGINWVNQTTPIYPPNVTGLVQCGDGIGSDPGPCNTFAMNRNFRTPYVENWTLGIQHAFSGKLGFDVSYVGNLGVKLPADLDLNHPDPVARAPP